MRGAADPPLRALPEPHGNIHTQTAKEWLTSTGGGHNVLSMNENLLAPPRVSPRVFAGINGGIALLAVIILSVMTIVGARTPMELLRGSAVILILHTASTLAYFRFVRLASRTRAERLPLIHGCIFASSMTAYMGTIGLLFYGSVIAGFREQGGMIAMMAGFFLAQCGWTRRVGDTKHCPQCEYEFGHADETDAPIRCPECGTGWLGRLKKGRRVRSRKLIVIGIVGGFLTMILLNPIFYFPALAPRLATPVLFVGLYAAPRSGFSAWGELITRPLDPHWAQIMAEKVLALRQERNWTDSGWSEWFEAMIATNQIPASLVDRYYRESFCADLVVPTHVKPGESFSAMLRVTRAAGGFRNQMGVMFSGYVINDAIPLAGRCTQTLWRHDLSPGVFTSKRDVLGASLIAPSEGTFQVRAVFWVVHQPSFMDELRWQEDGTPTTPKAALWFERRELVKTISVVR